MEYIVHKEFHGRGICGEVSLQVGTKCTERDGVIYHGVRAICLADSHNAHTFFARNTDGGGLERGALIGRVKETLAAHPERWARVLADPVCRQFDKSPAGDTREWSAAFYHAGLPTLRYIANLVTEEEDT